MKKISVALLFGGESGEREVSLVSGQAVFSALQKNEKFTVEKFDTKFQLPAFLKNLEKFDVVFPVLHGPGGEDGTLQGLCEFLKIPCVGARSRASANCMHKAVSKMFFRAAGIPVAPDIFMCKFTGSFTWQRNGGQILQTENFTEILEAAESSLGFPIVVKPATNGSSVGVRIVKNQKGLLEICQEIFSEIDSEILLEKFLPGKEITVGVLGNLPELQAFAPIEIVANTGEFYDFQSKYSPGGSTHHLPARIGEGLLQRAQDLACKAHTALGCAGFSRTDFMLHENELHCLEINTIPGFTPTSLFPESAQHAGISFGELCERLIFLALNFSQKK